MTTVVSRRLMSTSTTTGGPRLHKAKDAWEALKAARPHDEHPHVRIYFELYIGLPQKKRAWDTGNYRRIIAHRGKQGSGEF